MLVLFTMGTRALTRLAQRSIGASVEDALRSRSSLNEGLSFVRSAARSAARNPYLLSVSNRKTATSRLQLSARETVFCALAAIL